MKISNVRNRKDGSLSLQIRLGKAATLDYARAQWLTGDPSRLLPKFLYEKTPRETLLYYEVTGLVPLHTFLKTQLSPLQYETMLYCVLEVANLCTEQEIPLHALLWSEKLVFVDPADAALVFIVIPASGMSTGEASVNTLIALFANNRRVRFIARQDLQLCETLDDYTQRYSLFSTTEFHSTLQRMFPDHIEELKGHGVADSRATESGNLQSRRETIHESRVSSAYLDPVSMVIGAPSTSQVNQSKSVSQRVAENLHESATLTATGGVTDQPTAIDARLVACPPAVELPPGTAGTRRFAVIRIMDSRSIVITKSIMSIGRSQHADIQMPGNSNTSRIHARLVACDDGTFQIMDLDSSNGTFVAGHRLVHGETATLRIDEPFRLGDDEYVVQMVNS